MEELVNQKLQQLILRFHQLGGELPPLDKFDITPAQVVYLDYLARHPDCRLSQLTEALQYSAASVSAMVSLYKTVLLGAVSLSSSGFPVSFPQK